MKRRQSPLVRRLTRGLKGAIFCPKTEREQDLFAEAFDRCAAILRKHDSKMLRRAALRVDEGTL